MRSKGRALRAPQLLGHRWSAIGREQREFAVAYLELVFDALFAAFSAQGTSRWWPHVKDLFASAVRSRGRSAPPSCALFERCSLDLKDEALWHLAVYLDGWYATVSAQEIPPGTMEPPLLRISEARYLLHIGASTLPAPLVEPKLPGSTWERVFQRLWRSVYVDYLFSRAQVAADALSVLDLVLAAAPFMKQLREVRLQGSTDLSQPWEEAIASLKAPASGNGPLTAGLAALSRRELDAAFREWLTLLSDQLVNPEWLMVEESRAGLIEHGLESVLLKGSNSLLGTVGEMDAYLHNSRHRARIEESCEAEVEEMLRPASWEVVLAVSGALDQELEAKDVGVVLSPNFPGGEPFGRRGDGCVYAHLKDVKARYGEEALELSRKRVRACLSALGVLSTPLEFEIRDAHYRRAGEDGWSGHFRREGMPIVPASMSDWNSVIRQAGPVLSAEDELGRRIREAFNRVAKARIAPDLEEQVEQSWGALELISGDAGASGASLLCYLPLFFVPPGFDEMNTAERLRAVAGAYVETRRAFDRVQEARNKALAHREVVAMDWRVLELHAAWVKRFSKEVLIAALVGWHGGARVPRELRRVLDRGYEKAYHFAIPSPEALARIALVESGPAGL